MACSMAGKLRSEFTGPTMVKGSPEAEKAFREVRDAINQARKGIGRDPRPSLHRTGCQRSEAGHRLHRQGQLRIECRALRVALPGPVTRRGYALCELPDHAGRARIRHAGTFTKRA